MEGRRRGERGVKGREREGESRAERRVEPIAIVVTLGSSWELRTGPGLARPGSENFKAETFRPGRPFHDEDVERTMKSRNDDHKIRLGPKRSFVRQFIVERPLAAADLGSEARGHRAGVVHRDQAPARRLADGHLVG